MRITLQYTNVLYAYVTAWDEQAAALRLLLDAVQTGGSDVEERVAALDRSRFARYWELLEQEGDNWRDPTHIAGLVADLRVRSDRSDLRAEAVLAAEKWIISHEIAHHLLGHTVRQGKRLPAAEVVAQLRNPTVAATLNPRQLEEYDADLLAHLLVSAACRPEGAPASYDIYQAEIGSVLALVSLTHITGHWGTSNHADATHPGFDVRFQIVADVVERLSGDMPLGSAGDHPLDLFIDLTLFAAAAYHAARRTAGTDGVERLTLLDLASEALHRKAGLRDRLSAESKASPGS